MDFFVEIIFRWLIVRILGVYTRYLFFKVFGKVKMIDQLSGNTKLKNNSYSQDFYNAVVGLIVFCLLSISIAYIIFS